MGMFKKSCWTNSTINTAPNPSPKHWSLEKLFLFSNAYIIVANYKDCTNFEGDKIMVFKGKYKPRAELDPHFSYDEDSPIARFKPTKEGLKLAIQLANEL